MPWLTITSAVISQQVVLIMGLYLLLFRRRTRERRALDAWLQAAAGAMMATAVFGMLSLGRWDVLQFYGKHLYLVALCVVALSVMQFAYRFSRPQVLQGEARVALIVSIVGTAAALGWALFQFGQLRPGGHPSTSTVWTNACIILAALWTRGVCVPQSLLLLRVRRETR